MKSSIQPYSKLKVIAFLITACGLVLSCDDEKVFDPTAQTGNSKTYTLQAISNAPVQGTVHFTERADHSTLVTIDMDGATPGIHPAHIYTNSMAETGDIQIELNPVDGRTGKSETIIKAKTDGSILHYDELIALDAHVQVQRSGSDTEAIAAADIGGNEISPISRTYMLRPANDSEVAGSVDFIKRVNGNTLVVVNLVGVSSTGYYRIFICDNDCNVGGTLAISLNSIMGGLGSGYTNVDQLNNGTPITYDELLNYNGHLRVVSPDPTPKCMALSNIGSNH